MPSDTSNTPVCSITQKSSCPMGRFFHFIGQGEKWMIVVFPLITLSVFMAGLLLAWLINAIIMPKIG
ncbi:MAG: hypothetical protein U0003_02175 [Vampirovibrionales bacterium]